MDPPVGTVGLLFTDIEGSTALAHALGPTFGEVLAAHHEVVGGAIAAHGGHVDGTEGDAFFALFADARDAVAAALDGQRALRRRTWATPDGRLRVRMGVHVGHVERQSTGYVGLEIHRAARVASAAHGGQLLLTEAARALAGDLVTTESLGRHRLKDFPVPEVLHCAVIDGEGAGAFPPPKTLEARPTNLPADERLFVGRSAELADIAAALSEDGDRLVTLSGMGGSGKTRLALAAGLALLDAHPGGVWWVPLASATDVDAVLPALAAALRVTDDGARPLLEAVAARVGQGPALAVLDNLEQLDAAPVVSRLLEAVPGLRVLATSQTPLRLSLERILPVPPLDRDASRELFERVGARVRPGFTLTPETAVVADELCERLDHLPLAVELAAARLSVLSPEQLLDRLGAPLKLLKGGARDLPERQRSLRATVEWTLGLLDPDARALFTRLGVFAGPVELADIEAVCEDDGLDVLDAVATLIDVGLLRRREDGTGVVTFRLPEALRQYAAAELESTDAGPALRRAHAEHVLQAVWPAGLCMGCSLADFLRADRLDREEAQALGWAEAHDRRLAGALAGARASRIGSQGRVRQAQQVLAGVGRLDDLPPRTAAMVLIAEGLLRLSVGDAQGPLDTGRRALAFLQREPDPEMEAYAQLTVTYGCVYAGVGDWRAEDERMRELAARASAVMQATALVFSGQYHVFAGDLAIAEERIEAGAQLAERVGARAAANLDTSRADLHLAAGDSARAARLYHRSIEVCAQRGELTQVVGDLYGLAISLAVAGCDAAALEAMGLAEPLAAELGLAPQDTRGLPRVEALAEARARLGPQATEDAIARGRAVPAGRRVPRAAELVAVAKPSPVRLP